MSSGFVRFFKDMNCLEGVFRSKTSSVQSSSRHYNTRIPEQAPDQFAGLSRAEKPKKSFSLSKFLPLNKEKKTLGSNSPVQPQQTPMVHQYSVPMPRQQQTNFVRPSIQNHPMPSTQAGYVSTTGRGNSVIVGQPQRWHGDQSQLIPNSQLRAHSQPLQAAAPQFRTEEEAIEHALRQSKVTAQQESEKRADTLTKEMQAVEKVLGKGHRNAPAAPTQTAAQAAEEEENFQKAVRASIKDQKALENEQKTAYETLTKDHTLKTEPAETLKPGQLIPVESQTFTRVEPSNNPWAWAMVSQNLL